MKYYQQRRCWVQLWFVACLSLPVVCYGATATWNYDGDDSWFNATRWTGGIPSSDGDLAYITNSLTGARTITIDAAGATVGSLVIGNPGGSYSYQIASSGGNVLTFLYTGFTVSLFQPADSPSNTISAPITLNNNLVVTNNSTNALVLSGNVTGTKTLTKYGPGPLILAGSNDLSGLTVREGILRLDVAKSQAFSFSAGVYSNGVLLYNNINQSDWFGGTLYNGGTLCCAGTSSCQVANNGFLVAGDGTGTIATVNSSDVFTFLGNSGLAGGNSNSLFVLPGPGTIVLARAAGSASPLYYYGSYRVSGGTVRLTHPNGLALLTNLVTLAGGTLETRLDTNVLVSGYCSLAGNARILLNRNSAGPGVQHVFWNGMEIVSNRVLTVQAGDNVTSGTMTGLVSGVMLKNNVTLNVTNGVSAGTTLFVSSMVETGAACSVIKDGNGGLVLQGTNEWAGSTVVTNGTLSVVDTNGLWGTTNVLVCADNGAGLSLLSSSAISTSALVYVRTGAGRITLAADTTNAVRFLYVDGLNRKTGTWGSSSSPALNKNDACFQGDGVLVVREQLPDKGTVVILR